MGGGGEGGMTDEQRYYQEKQIELQEESLKQAKASVIEPAKSVSSKMKGATAATEQAAALRRGISSTFNRPAAFANAGSGSATSGTSAKLGS